jgi:hypothetical protein
LLAASAASHGNWFGKAFAATVAPVRERVVWIQLLGIPLDFGVACIHRLAVFIEAQNISRRVDDVCFSKAAGVPAVRAPDSCSLLLRAVSS